MNGIIFEVLFEKPTIDQQPSTHVATQGVGRYTTADEGEFLPTDELFGEEEYTCLGDALVEAGRRIKVREAAGWLIDETQWLPGDR
jgi:hypothetical protein